MSAPRSKLIVRMFQYLQRARTPIILPETTIAMGIIAVIFGRRSAAAFGMLTNDFLARSMGVVMIVGGGLISLSFLRYDAYKEAIGLALAALGTAIYATSVFIYLGIQGLITGIGFTGLTLVFLSRIWFIVRAYRARKQLSDAADTDGAS
jgi:hypothetical protein